MAEFVITSKWDSKMFEVKPKTPREHNFKLSEYYNKHIQNRTKFFVLPAFGIIVIMTIVITIIYFIGVLHSLICLLIILSINWFGAVIGMFAVYRWGI